MSAYKIVSAFLLIVTIVGCDKKVSELKNSFTISGRLLESSSNPIPVANHQLSFYQSRYGGFISSIDGIEKIATTENDGSFNFTYSLSSSPSGTTNPNLLDIISRDFSKYPNLFASYKYISPGIDTNFNNLFLFKKIDKLVRKVYFEKAIGAGTELQLFTNDANNPHYKSVFGPVAAGATLVVDTINNFKVANLYLANRKYTILSLFTKPSYSGRLEIDVEIGDEKYREILMNYK